jgi:uncharacterized 2Fe-2S/4Fe-4S cluster protein (DUF4445 family)
LNQSCRGEMERLVQEITCVELANQEGFDKLFVRCLGF